MISPQYKTLVIIPARGNSKGLPGKNIKKLGEKPLIAYSIEFAKSLFDVKDICVSTDSPEIAEVASDYGLKVPFLRPSELALDNSGTYDVVLHALDFYKSRQIEYEVVLLLQPTSPFRLKKHIHEAFELFNKDIDMVISVFKTKANPYFMLLEENEMGFLENSKKGNFTARQQTPDVYEINGSIYIYNVSSLLRYDAFAKFQKSRKYLMDGIYSSDIDSIIDWYYIEFLLEKNLIAFD